MSLQELLTEVRTPWIQRVGQALAQGPGTRSSFEQQLGRFYDLMEHAILTGDSAWLDPILYDWARAQTETELEQGQYHVAYVMKKMISLTVEIARETLALPLSMDYVTAVLPLLAYGLEVVSRYEMETRLAHLSTEMADIERKWEQLDRSKSSFIAVAAHELKTPLTLIEGYTSMLRDAAIQPGEVGVDGLLEGVNTGVARLRQILDDMIDVSLIDNHLLSLNWQPVKIMNLLQLLNNDLEPTLRDRQQHLEIRTFDGGDSWIYADPERLYQALRNILVNAIKFTPDNGDIVIDGRSLPGFMEITVTDTGIGISPEDQPTIFEKFGQLGRVDLHSSSKTKFKGGGPGLGLAISRGIVEAHGGTIWVESEGYDEKQLYGSTFHILIPARKQAADPRITRLIESLETIPMVTNAQENSGTDHPAS